MHEIALSLGSNSGDRFYYLRKMEEALRSVLLPPVTISDLFKTEPLEVAEVQPWYLNRIIKGYYPSGVNDLFHHCIAIEQQLGRSNKGMRTERTADIDILLFGHEHINTDTLVVPHPALLRRRFCIIGLNQIMPDAYIPTNGKTVGECLTEMGHDIGLQGVEIVNEINREEFDA